MKLVYVIFFLILFSSISKASCELERDSICVGDSKEICSIGDCKNGYGRLECLNSNVREPFYEGNFKDCYPDGMGKEDVWKGPYTKEPRWRTGIYEGEFKLYDKANRIWGPHGYGVERMDTGTVYEGEFYAGRYWGKGEKIYADGGKYNGEWELGKKHGYGTRVFPSGDIYAGEYVYDDPHGYGIYIYAGGGRYEGEWKYGKNHGFGTHDYNNGDKYVGEYVDDKYHGYGTYRDHEHTYTGNWENGFRHGEGSYTVISGPFAGTYESGTWNQGDQVNTEGVLQWGGNSFPILFIDGVNRGPEIHESKKNKSSGSNIDWLRIAEIGLSIMGGTPIDSGKNYFQNNQSISGLTKSCSYSCAGSAYSITVGAAELCPLNPPCSSPASKNKINTTSGSQVCNFKKELVGGMNKVCSYSCIGNPHVITIGAAESCPITVKR